MMVMTTITYYYYYYYYYDYHHQAARDEVLSRNDATIELAKKADLSAFREVESVLKQYTGELENLRATASPEAMAQLR